MSRSRRKTPKGGITTAESEKKFKQFEHKKRRRHDNVLLDKVEEDGYSSDKEFGNPWAGPKDGKVWHGDYDNRRK